MAVKSLSRILGAALTLAPTQYPAGADQAGLLSPAAIAAAQDGRPIFIACAAANRILRLDPATREVAGFVALPGRPSGLCSAPDPARLFITCSAGESHVCIADPESDSFRASIPAGHAPMAPVLSPDGRTLYVCNRFDNDVSVIDLAAKKETQRISVQREPVAADITKDGKFLLVANHLHNARADTGFAAAVVSVIDLAAAEVVKKLQLPNGSGSLKDLRVSPDGKYAVVSHIISRFHRALSFIGRGWINVNALTIIGLARMEIYNTALLDEPDSGAANPWGVAWTSDSSKVVVTHAGTHEISIVDFPMVLEQLPNLATAGLNESDRLRALYSKIEAADNIPFLKGSHRRIKLPRTDLGPRAVAVIGHTAYVANYFSDTLSVIDLSDPQLKVESIPLSNSALRTTHSALGSSLPTHSFTNSLTHSLSYLPLSRQGEFYFHDATICFQGWQSCSSCHPDARSDGLNWDLLNDGEGNPKNTKSLLLAFQTPPAMWLGVRETPEAAVKAGIEHILFTKQPPEVSSAICEYIKSLKPTPSPFIVRGELSEAAKRGEGIFRGAGCVACHPLGLFTDLHPHDVGTRAAFDKPTDKFDTPTLVELWRTAPYLHDGSAATVREVLITRNPRDEHGKTASLSQQEIDDLCAYLLSL